MTLREWGKAERLLRNVLETDSELKAVALYQLSQVPAPEFRAEKGLSCFFFTYSNMCYM